MDKETFKLTIVNQFRYPLSPIRKLMYPRGTRLRNTTGKDCYAQESDLYASEFNLKIQVTHIPDKSDDPIFQVLFHELPPSTKLTEKGERNNLSGTAYKAITYRRECVEFVGNYIHFTWMTFTLDADDYEFRLVYPQRTYLLSYDIKANEHEKMDVLNAFREINKRESFPATDVYVEYLYTPAEAARLEVFLRSHFLMVGQKEHIMHAFEQPHYGRAKTSLGRIFETISKVQT